MLFQQTISNLPFKQWLLKDKENKRLFGFIVGAITIPFVWLKIVYPYPNFMPPDSYSYLETATTNQMINIWPIGYPKFLRLVSIFSRSHMALVVLQYMLLHGSLLYFLFSIRYLLSPGKWIFRILLALSILNPLLPHIANFISSDCLFATLSLLWFTQLLWIIYQPTQKLLFIHAIVLLFTFMVRFTAIYYPFISIIVIVLANMPRMTKWRGASFLVLPLLLFIGRTQYEYKIKTGTIQYSAFGGWQMAANALYGYAYAKPNDPKTVPQKFRDLHIIVNNHMNSLRHLPKFIRPDREVAIYYLWNFNSPLRIYLNEQWHKNNGTPYFKQWASLAPLYDAYGRYLIGKHPGLFLKYYAWPNLIRYYAPPVYFMGRYNMGNKKVDSIAVSWFDWKTNQLPTRSKDRKIHILNFFPTILSIVNPMFLLSCIVFICLGGLKKCSWQTQRIIGCMLVVWFSNTIFSVFSAPVELRYLLFPISITLPFGILLISSIIKSLQSESVKTQKPEITLPEPAIQLQ